MHLKVLSGKCRPFCFCLGLNDISQAIIGHFGQHGSGYGLLPDGTKSLPKPNLHDVKLDAWAQTAIFLNQNYIFIQENGFQILCAKCWLFWVGLNSQ